MCRVKKLCYALSMRQLALFEEEKQNEFGGSLLRGKRKSHRPLDTNCIQHLILKASAHGVLLKYREQISGILNKYGVRHGVKIHDLAVNDDHIHLAIAFAHRISYARWIRSVTAMLVREFKVGWKFRPYTRNVCFGRGLTNLKIYLAGNRAEADFTVRADDAVAACLAEAEKFILNP